MERNRWQIEEEMSEIELLESKVEQLELQKQLEELEKQLYEHTALPKEMIVVNNVIGLLRGRSLSEESYYKIREVLDATMRPKGPVTITISKEQAKKHLLNFKEDRYKKNKDFISEKEMKL